ncbi:hypothetical protein [Streptomyces sp. NPDC002671]
MTTVHAEWALHGKLPERRHDYHILGSSRDRAEDARFDRLIREATPGTPQGGGADAADALPWVTFDVSGGADEGHWTGIAVKEWSPELDEVGRRITTTRYFTFPFLEAAGPAVSYRGLYDQVAPIGLPLPSADAVPLDLPALDPHALADRMTADPRGFDWYAAVAALLLDGPVALIGAGALPLAERIDCLDAIVALLPYGARASLRASTWADNLADHDVRLFFGEWVGKSHQHHVLWSDRPEPGRGTLGDVYLSALRDAHRRHGEPGPLLAQLARETGPLELNDERNLLAAVDVLAAPEHRRAAREALLTHAKAASPEQLARRWTEAREAVVAGAGAELASGSAQLARSYLEVAQRLRQADSYVDDVLRHCPPDRAPGTQAALLTALRPPAPGACPELHRTVVTRPAVVHQVLRQQLPHPRAPLEHWLAWLCTSGRAPAPDWLKAFGALLPERAGPVPPSWLDDVQRHCGAEALPTLLRTAGRTGTIDLVLYGAWRPLLLLTTARPGSAHAALRDTVGGLAPADPANRAGLDVLSPLLGVAPVWAARTSPDREGARYWAGFLNLWDRPELFEHRDQVGLALIAAVPRNHWLLRRLRHLDPELARAVATRRRPGFPSGWLRGLTELRARRAAQDRRRPWQPDPHDTEGHRP